MARRDPSGAARRQVLAWHRRIGLAAAALVLTAAVTGVALNHVEALSLGKRSVSWSWLMDWYGIGHRTEPVSFRAGEVWVTLADGALYVDGRPTGQRAGQVVGAAAAGGIVAVATPRAVLLFGDGAALVERVPAAAVGGAIARLGTGEDGRVVVAAAGSRHVADSGFLSWSPTAQSATWSQPETAPEAVLGRVERAARGEGLPLDRVILDVHSGRILGSWGPYLMDIVALSLVILSVTGFYNWIKGRRR